MMIRPATPADAEAIGQLMAQDAKSPPVQVAQSAQPAAAAEPAAPTQPAAPVDLSTPKASLSAFANTLLSSVKAEGSRISNDESVSKGAMNVFSMPVVERRTSTPLAVKGAISSSLAPLSVIKMSMSRIGQIKAVPITPIFR